MSVKFNFDHRRKPVIYWSLFIELTEELITTWVNMTSEDKGRIIFDFEMMYLLKVLRYQCVGALNTVVTIIISKRKEDILELCSNCLMFLNLNFYHIRNYELLIDLPP